MVAPLPRPLTHGRAHGDGASLPVAAHGMAACGPHAHRRDVGRFDGARLYRTGDRPDVHVREHAHDWPTLSVFVCGSYRNASDRGEQVIAAPAVLFYRAGDAHANAIGPYGHEQVELEFDPAWLAPHLPRLPDRPLRLVGGTPAHASRTLLRLLAARNPVEGRIALALAGLLQRCVAADVAVPPPWLSRVETHLARTDGPRTTGTLADAAGVSAAWLTRAYRLHTGEGIAERLRRQQAEHATRLP